MTKKGTSWDDIAEETEPLGMSPEMARKLLQVNPALRGQGLSTDVLVHQPVSQKKNDLDATISAASAWLNGELARVEQARLEAQQAALARVQRWLQTNDPEMKKPETQQALKVHAAELKAIGFPGV